jgi:hypothetical protein
LEKMRYGPPGTACTQFAGRKVTGSPELVFDVLDYVIEEISPLIGIEVWRLSTRTR